MEWKNKYILVYTYMNGVKENIIDVRDHGLEITRSDW